MPVIRAPLDGASRAALRAILTARPDAQAVEYPSFVTDQSSAADPPLLSTPDSVERVPAEPIGVGPPEAGVTGFLDGTQRARILTWLDGVPYVFGTAAAAVRMRHERRLSTWTGAGPLIDHHWYVPLTYSTTATAIGEWTVVDTTAESLGPIPSRHPAALLERALNCLQRDREALERRLAERWTEELPGVLCADGPLPAAGPARSSPSVIGVIKNHRTIYADGPALDLVYSLREGERSPAFEVRSRSRQPVLSWYLRTRDPAARDALWGLVRIESAPVANWTSRADEVSRWILAEKAPVALPDQRWDRMTYGVQNCESFLKAVS